MLSTHFAGNFWHSAYAAQWQIFSICKLPSTSCGQFGHQPLLLKACSCHPYTGHLTHLGTVESAWLHLEARIREGLFEGHAVHQEGVPQASALDLCPT